MQLLFIPLSDVIMEIIEDYIGISIGQWCVICQQIKNQAHAQSFVKECISEQLIPSQIGQKLFQYKFNREEEDIDYLF